MGKGIYEGASGRVCILSWLQPGAQQLLGSPISPVIAQSDGHCRRWEGRKGPGSHRPSVQVLSAGAGSP